VRDALVTSWGGVYGGRAYSTSVGAAGSGAYYWSSTQSGNENAYRLFFNTSGYVNPQDDNDKRYGFQVRCVK
jgi:uncharacterized protein (TIGR02145 family)